jgi:putative hydrolase of HD superfamily
MPTDEAAAARLVDTLLALDPLTDLPRTGWVLRGVASAESIAAHSFGVAITAMAIVDALREDGQTVDGEAVLRMALLHDASEAATGDVPMPAKTEALKTALAEAEATIAARLVPQWTATWAASQGEGSLEARIVHAADKLQMMAKCLAYARAGRGRLDDFWANPKNRNDCGLRIVELAHQEIVRRRPR